MVFEGASVDDLRTFAGSLSSASSRLLSIRHELVAKARSVHWPGPDGDRYRSDVTLQLSSVKDPVSDAYARSQGVEPLQIVELHAYMVEGVNDNGTVTLVNPWGSQAGYSGDEGAHRITITEKQYQLYFNQAYQAADRSTWK